MTPERTLSATSKALRACASGVDRATPLASALARPAFRAASAWVAFWLAAFASLVRRVGGAATLDAAVAATRRATMLARAAAPAAPRRRRAKGKEEEDDEEEDDEDEDDEYRGEIEPRYETRVPKGPRARRGRGGVETARGAATSDDAARNVFRFDASDIHKVF